MKRKMHAKTLAIVLATTTVLQATGVASQLLNGVSFVTANAAVNTTTPVTETVQVTTSAGATSIDADISYELPTNIDAEADLADITVSMTTGAGAIVLTTTAAVTFDPIAKTISLSLPDQTAFVGGVDTYNLKGAYTSGVFNVTVGSVATPLSVSVTTSASALVAKVIDNNNNNVTTNSAVTYNWFRNNTLVTTASGATFNLSAGDKGTSIFVKVGVNTYTTNSAATLIGWDPTPAVDPEKPTVDPEKPAVDPETPIAEGTKIDRVSIRGTERVGRTLEARLLDKDGNSIEASSTVTYEWYRLSSKNDDVTDGKLVEDDDNYDLVSSDRGNYIKLVVTCDGNTYEDITGEIESSSSSSSSSDDDDDDDDSVDNSENNDSTSNDSTTPEVSISRNAEGILKLVENGQPVVGWKQVNGVWYLGDVTGTAQTGWQQVNGAWYLLNGSGAMTTGWQQVNGAWYLLNGSGAMATGWQQVNGAWYLLNGSGAMATGWQQVNGTWYLLNGNGAMATGWQQTNGKWYYLNSDGSMASNTVIDGYRVNASGAWV